MLSTTASQTSYLGSYIISLGAYIYSSEFDS